VLGGGDGDIATRGQKCAGHDRWQLACRDSCEVLRDVVGGHQRGTHHAQWRVGLVLRGVSHGARQVANTHAYRWDQPAELRDGCCDLDGAVGPDEACDPGAVQEAGLHRTPAPGALADDQRPAQIDGETLLRGKFRKRYWQPSEQVRNVLEYVNSLRFRKETVVRDHHLRLGVSSLDTFIREWHARWLPARA
jgi:hypothetical protein